MTSAKPKPLLAGESRAYPVLPLRDIVVFPHMIVPLFVGGKSRSRRSKRSCARIRSSCWQRRRTLGRRSRDRRYLRVGTLASVLQLLKLPDGTVKVLVEADCARGGHELHRARTDYYEAEAVVVTDSPAIRSRPRRWRDR